ncbi:hypothetical protein DF219_11135 [Corynebacterium liangguodongii]|nr:hypothetical protein DF219_11135 [Corynebacterium liangguodongii]
MPLIQALGIEFFLRDLVNLVAFSPGRSRDTPLGERTLQRYCYRFSGRIRYRLPLIRLRWGDAVM